MAIVAIVLISLGALNSVLAVNAGTCTQGDAGNLFGGLITLVLYMAGGLIMAFKPLQWRQISAFLPAAAIALWHSVFALRFAWGYFVDKISACDAMLGDFLPQSMVYEKDGREVALAILWLGLSAIFWLVMLLAWLQARRRIIRSAG
jgi:hypothetical protein